MKCKRIIILLSHPIQYFSPLFQKMAKENINLLVLYCSNENVEGHYDKDFGVHIKWDIPLLKGYNYKFLKNNSWKPSIFKGFFGLINFQLFKELKKEKGSYLVIHSWSYATSFIAIVAAKKYGVKLCLRTENPLNQELLKSPAILFLRKIFFKYLFFRLFDYFFYIGKQNKNLYEYYGVIQNKLFFTPYSVDNERLQYDYLKYKDKKEELRSELGLPNVKTIILTSGKYIPKKKHMDLLEAYRMLNYESVALVFLGEGKLRREMEYYIQNHNLKNVFLPGFKNQTEIGKYFASADIFVLPSGAGETWGLVVNEAMNFALPVIVNNLAGSVSDLVADDNGFIFKTHTELAENLRKLIDYPELIKQKGSVSFKKIANYSYSKTIESLMKI